MKVNRALTTVEMQLLTQALPPACRATLEQTLNAVFTLRHARSGFSPPASRSAPRRRWRRIIALQTAAAAELQSMCRADAAGSGAQLSAARSSLLIRRTRGAWATQRDDRGVLQPHAGGGWVGVLPQACPSPTPRSTGAACAGSWLSARYRKTQPRAACWWRTKLGIASKRRSACRCRTSSAAHLETERGRYLMRLELRALSTALLSNGRAPPQRRAGCARVSRWRGLPRSLKPRAQEAALDRNEGLASYTGVKLGAGENAALFAARTLDAYDHHEALARAYAYASGPAYGLLLDDYAAGLAHELGGWAPARPARRPAARRGASDPQSAAPGRALWRTQIAAEERARAEAQRARIAELARPLRRRAAARIAARADAVRVRSRTASRPVDGPGQRLPDPDPSRRLGRVPRQRRRADLAGLHAA